MLHLRSSTSDNLIDSPLDDQAEEVNAEASSPDTQETSEVISPDNTDPVTEDNEIKVDYETVEPADNIEDNVSQETGQTEDQEDSSQEADQTVDQEDTSQEADQTVDQEGTSQESNEQEEETGESQTIIISMPEAPGEEPVTYEYITVSPSSNDIAVDFTETNTYLSIICVLLLFFTIVCICRYIYKFFSMFF